MCGATGRTRICRYTRHIEDVVRSQACHQAERTLSPILAIVLETHHTWECVQILMFHSGLLYSLPSTLATVKGTQQLCLVFSLLALMGLVIRLSSKYNSRRVIMHVVFGTLD